MGEKIANVRELLKRISTDDEFIENVQNEIKNRTVSQFLLQIRCEHNLTQNQIAQKIGCSQSRISKIETSCDDEISIDDLLSYAKALKLKLEIGFRHESITIVDLIKYHVYKIKGYLAQLRSLVKGDESLNKGIANFHIEALYNIGKAIIEGLGELNVSRIKVQDKSPIHISAPYDITRQTKVDKESKITKNK